MNQFKTEQEMFWAGDFGKEYTDRNKGGYLIASNTALFASILSKTKHVKSVIEFGANRGLNLLAINNLFLDIELSAIEINSQAVEELNSLGCVKVYQDSILNYSADYQRDFVLSKGLLIHINPQMLDRAYEVLYESSKHYICLVEYYHPSPVEVDYRGNQGKLFKRDFAGEMLDRFADLQLSDYGFVYHRDNNFQQDDLTWFLLEKGRRGE